MGEIQETRFFRKLKEYHDYKKNIKTQELPILELMSFDFLDGNNILYRKNPIMYTDKLWWVWSNKQKKWVVADDVQVILSFSEHFTLTGLTTTIHHTNIRNAVLNALKQAGQCFYNQFIKKIEPNWIVFKDCIVDVLTGEVIEHDFTYFVTNSLPYNYNDPVKSDLKKIDKLFTDWVIDKKKDGEQTDKSWVKTLYEIVAYSILPNYPIEVLFCLHGDGSNGKSSFIELLIKFVGLNNVTTTELALLTNPNSRFETASLHNKLICLMSELNESVIKNTAILKKLTSNKEPLRAEYKGKGQMMFINYAKLIMSTNIIPNTTDKTDGYYRRWLVIDFPNKFDSTNGDVLRDINADDLHALAIKSIDVLKELLQKNTFTNFRSIRDRRIRYENKANPLKRFINEYCVVADNVKQPVFEFFDIFSNWITERNYMPYTKPRLTHALKDYDVESKVLYNPDNQKSWRYYIGIKIKPDKLKITTTYDTETNRFVNVKTLKKDNDFLTNPKIMSKNVGYKLENLVEMNPDLTKEEIIEMIKKYKKEGLIAERSEGRFTFETYGDEINE